MANPIPFASLPATPNFVGQSFDITDSVTATKGAIETGGGRCVCTVFWNGLNWIDNPSLFQVGSSTVTGVSLSEYTVSQLPTYPQTVLADNPVAYWRMGEASGNFADSTVNANTAVATGITTYNVTGSVVDDPNGGITNTGTTGKGLTATSASQNVGDVFTVEFAFKRSATLGTLQYIMVQTATAGFQIYFNTANLISGAKIGGGNWLFGQVPFTDQNWHLCQVTKNGSVVGLYVDGQPSQFVAGNQTIAPATYAVSLCSNNGASGFIGSLDEMALYPTALSAARCQAHYNQWVAQKNGAIVYATDGTPASNPVTGGGAGVTVTYYQGKWAAIL